jgi:hypothetical protein
MNKIILGLICISFIFIAGCSPNPSPIPTNLPQQTQQTQPNETLKLEYDITEINDTTIITIKAGNEAVFFMVQDNYLDVINCGNKPYAPVVVEALDEFLTINPQLILRNLHIPKLELDFIGGCKNILQKYNTQLSYVYLIEGTSNLDEFQDIITWTPSNKLIRTNPDLPLE